MGGGGGGHAPGRSAVRGGHRGVDRNAALIALVDDIPAPILADILSFTASVPAAGALWPLRDPDAPELDEDDDGGQE